MIEIRNRSGAYFRRHRWISIWAASLVSVFVVILAAFTPTSPIDRLNSLVFDAYQNLKPRPPTGSPITIVDIDDASIAELGQWPWPRTVLARFIDRLTEMGAAVIGLDILLSEPDRTSPVLVLAELERQGFDIAAPGEGAILDHDIHLSQTFARSPVVSGLALAESTRTPPPDPKAGYGFGGANPLTYLPSYEGSVRNLPVLDAAATGIGLINFPPARDGVVREIPLISRYGDKLYPALALEALRVAQGASSYVIRSTGAHGEQDTGDPAMVAIKDGRYEIPTGPDGKMWVYFSGATVANVVSASRLLAEPPYADLANIVNGHIVLAGTSAIGLRDLVSTPLASGVPGVFVHAEIIDQILGGNFLSRPDWAVGAEVVLAIALSLLVLGFLPFLPSLANGLIAANALAVSVVTGWLAFAWYNLLVSPLLAVLCILCAYGFGSGVRLLLSESERRYIRSAFSQYLSPSMVDRLVENPQVLALGGENRELTVLFCDVRGFTSLSEGLGPTEITEFLNNYLTPMTAVLMASGATIDKYMGDGIMAFWNAPLDVPDHRRKACESILAMEEALDAFNRRSGYDVRIGIGLNTGVCCVGNLGSRQRFDYSAIGDPVNVAARIEGMTKQYGLTNLIAASTVEGAGDFELLEIDRVRLVGRGAPTPLFHLLLHGQDFADREQFVRFKTAHQQFLRCFRGMAFEEAERALNDVSEMAPAGMKKLYRIFRDRIHALKLDPPTPGWDGTYMAREK